MQADELSLSDSVKRLRKRLEEITQERDELERELNAKKSNLAKIEADKQRLENEVRRLGQELVEVQMKQSAIVIV